MWLQRLDRAFTQRGDARRTNADELGPEVPRTFRPPLGWSPDRHQIKAPLECFRAPETTWVYGELHFRCGDNASG